MTDKKVLDMQGKYVLSRQEESLLERIEYCRAFLFVNKVIGPNLNYTLKKKIRKEKENG